MWWYYSMASLACINIALFFVVHHMLLAKGKDRCDRGSQDHQKDYHSKMYKGGLTVLIVFAYRCFFLVSTMDRFVWHDTIFSSVMLIKLLTYAAEQSYVGMIIYCCAEMALQVTEGKGRWWTYSKFGTGFLGAAIIVGQIFSFVGMVKKSNIYLLIRAYCVAFGFLALAPIPLHVLYCGFKESREKGNGVHKGCWDKDQGLTRIGELVALVLSLFVMFYVPWYIFVELPLFHRRQGMCEGSSEDLSFLNGFWDALFFRVPTKNWEVWKTVVWWNTACATLGSWSAILLSIGPKLPEKNKESTGGFSGLLESCSGKA
jgi:hypothetical protein